MPFKTKNWVIKPNFSNRQYVKYAGFPKKIISFTSAANGAIRFSTENQAKDFIAEHNLTDCYAHNLKK